jgi:hypothetical protein
MGFMVEDRNDLARPKMKMASMMALLPLAFSP